MKLADLNRKISEIAARIKHNCLVQEGEKTIEDPAELMKELDGSIDRLRYLMAAINKTNNIITVDGRTLTEIIAEKDAANIRLSSYRSFVNEVGSRNQRARFSEIKIIPAVDGAELQKKADACAKKVRELDNALQQANWLNDLIEI